MQYERGVILGPDTEINVATNKVHMITSEPNAGLLRHALLYWDKIDFPQNNIIRVESRDIEFLKQVGVAQTTQIRMSMGGEMAALYVAAQFAAFRHLNKENPDMWTLGQHAKSFTGFSSEITKAQLAEIEINGVLPTPPDDTPLADILELKQKRQNEFRALPIAVDELYDEVLKSAQMPRAESAAVHRLQTVIEDIRNCVDQSWLDRLKSSVKFDFNIPTAIANAINGGVAASVMFDPTLAPIGAAAGAMVNSIKFESKLGSVLKNMPENTKGFAYLYHVEKAFGHR
jgi:hypothetical protein